MLITWDPRKAEANIRKAIEVAPQSPVGYIHMGNLRLEQEKYADANNFYEQALTRDPTAADALLGIARVDSGQNHWDEAVARGTTVSSLGGQTLDPYDLTRAPGGSSGGSAVAVAANFAAATLGTDTSGSIRIPSAHNNVVGLRPTLGLSSRTGIIPFGHTQDTGGPIARTVEDVAIVLADAFDDWPAGRPQLHYFGWVVCRGQWHRRWPGSVTAGVDAPRRHSGSNFRRLRSRCDLSVSVRRHSRHRG